MSSRALERLSPQIRHRLAGLGFLGDDDVDVDVVDDWSLGGVDEVEDPGPGDAEPDVAPSSSDEPADEPSSSGGFFSWLGDNGLDVLKWGTSTGTGVYKTVSGGGSTATATPARPAPRPAGTPATAAHPASELAAGQPATGSAAAPAAADTNPLLLAGGGLGLGLLFLIALRSLFR
jgi:hypothetical protein